MIREESVKRAVKRYLDKDYKEISSRELHETGIDLTFRHRKNGRFIFIEAKGERGTKADEKEKLVQGLGQLVTKFKLHDNYYFALAFPFAWGKRAFKKIGRDAMHALNMRLFLVREDGHVVEVNKKNYERMKKMLNNG